MNMGLSQNRYFIELLLFISDFNFVNIGYLNNLRILSCCTNTNFYFQSNARFSKTLPKV